MKGSSVLLLLAAATLMGVTLILTYRLGEEATRTLLTVLAGAGFGFIGVVIGFALGRRSAINDPIRNLNQPTTQVPQTPVPMILNIPQPKPVGGAPMYEQALGEGGFVRRRDSVDGDGEQAPLMWQVK
jgi:hypothetical protein